MLILNKHEVATVLDIDNLVEALAPAMADLSRGVVSQAPRSAVEISEHNGILAVMPAYLPSYKVLGSKLVNIFPDNHRLGLPSHQAIIAVFDSCTGSPIAVMDGTFITTARTAAGSSLATKLLSRVDSTILGLIGTGVQAKAHALAMPRIRPIREIRVSGRDMNKCEALALELSQELMIPTKVTEVEDAVRGVDIVCIATHSPDPILKGEWMKPGVHVNSVGLNFKGRELDDETVRKALVAVESREAALAPSPAGANDLVWPISNEVVPTDHTIVEIGELILGIRKGRVSPNDITLYKSVGVAIQDAVAAGLAITAAREQGIGTEVCI